MPVGAPPAKQEERSWSGASGARNRRVIKAGASLARLRRARPEEPSGFRWPSWPHGRTKPKTTLTAMDHITGRGVRLPPASERPSGPTFPRMLGSRPSRCACGADRPRPAEEIAREQAPAVPAPRARSPEVGPRSARRAPEARAPHPSRAHGAPPPRRCPRAPRHPPRPLRLSRHGGRTPARRAHARALRAAGGLAAPRRRARRLRHRRHCHSVSLLRADRRLARPPPRRPPRDRLGRDRRGGDGDRAPRGAPPAHGALRRDARARSRAALAPRVDRDAEGTARDRRRIPGPPPRPRCR